MLFFLAALPATAAESSTSRELDEALRELRVSAAVWRDNDREYRAAGLAGQLPKEEMVQFAEFIAELKREVLEDCRAVRLLGGERFLAQYDCDLPKSRGGSAVTAPSLPSSPPEQHRTEAEVIRSFDDELRKIEAELDVMVREKSEASRPRVASRDNGSQSTTQGRGSATGSGSPAGSGTQLSPRSESAGPERGSSGGGAGDVVARGGSMPQEGDPNAATGQQDPGAGPGNERKGPTIKTNNSASPSGDDDDVVAAQIREAAEKETDPVLKEKLWAEYRKLKAAKN